MMKYVGGGAFIHGVPARDLTAAEAKQFADVIAEQEKLSGMTLYESAKKPAKKKTESD